MVFTIQSIYSFEVHSMYFKVNDHKKSCGNTKFERSILEKEDLYDA